MEILSYIADSDPKKDPANHPADGGDNDNNDSSDDDDDDDDVEKDEEDDEEEENLALADPSAILIDDLTKSHTARMCVRPHTLRSPIAKACIIEFVAALPSSSLPPSVSPPLENIKSLKDNIEASI
ncbi:hypothetical protein Tco_1012249 [Tanacetum coccineum]